MYSSISLKKRIVALSIVVVLGFCALCVRLYFVQINSSDFLQSKALDQWLRDIPLQAKRGTITDTKGIVLASSYSVYNIYVRHASVKDEKAEAELYASILELDKEEVFNKISDYKISEVLIKNNVEKSKVQELLNAGLTSFVASECYTRSYNYDALLSQILGFTSTDGQGISGLELYYDNYLKGVNGLNLVDGDAKGTTIQSGESNYIPSIDGLNIELTIDFNLQSKVEVIMQNALSETNAKSVSCMVTNPQNGEILSVITLPSYNLNDIPRDDLECLYSLSRSFVINDSYEPGSTFKTVVAAIALDIGVSNINKGYYCPGYRIIDGVRVNCHKKTGHGSQTLTTGFINSCNCVFMQVAQDIGKDKFYDYLSKFKFDSTLGIDYPGEASGIIIDKENASSNDFLRMGFGQSIAISGLQLMASIGAVCTDGCLVKPHFVKSITTSSGEEIYKTSISKISRVVKESVVKDMQYIMQQVVLRGGGKASAIEGYTVGGKTGTAQKYDNGVVSTGNYIASYICASPIENPEYLILVIIDEPKTSIYGNIVATPVAGEILNVIYGTKNSEPNPEDLVVVPDLIGTSLTEAGGILTSLGLYYVVEGDGEKVTSQSVQAGTSVIKGSSIMIKF